MGCARAATGGGRPLPESSAAATPRRDTIVAIIVSIVVVIVIGVPVVVFWFGEDLFGSDAGTIDDYNRETLESCDVPDGTTLVRVYVAPVEDLSGRHYRSMGFVYASPYEASQLAAALGVDVGYELTLPGSAACRFGIRPEAWVTDVDAAGVPGDADQPFWGGTDADVESQRPIPTGTRSLLRLRLAQEERDGALG